MANNPAASQPDIQKDLDNYQRLSQQLQMVLMQKQQTDLTTSENERAVKALTSASDGTIYRMAGSVLVPRKKDDLEKELAEEAETLKLRKEVLGKQEEQLKKTLTSLVERLEKAAKESKGKDLFGQDGTTMSG